MTRFEQLHNITRPEFNQLSLEDRMIHIIKNWSYYHNNGVITLEKMSLRCHSYEWAEKGEELFNGKLKQMIDDRNYELYCNK